MNLPESRTAGMMRKMLLRIAAGYALALIFSIALGLSAISSMNSLRRISENLYENPFKVSIAAQEIKSSIALIRERMLYMIFAGRPEKVSGTMAEISGLDGKIGSDMAFLKTAFLGDMGKIFEAERLMEQWRKERRLAIELEMGGQHEKARLIVETRGGEIYESLSADMDYVAGFAKQRANALANEANREESGTITRIVWFLAGLVVVSSVTAGYVLDRTWRMMRRSEQVGKALLESETRAQSAQYTRSLIEASLDPLVTISIEGKITDVNEATVKATGADRKELVGSDFSDYFTEPEKAQEGYRQVFEKGMVSDYPLTIRHRDGKLMDVLYNASVYWDKEGKVQGVFAAARDITERKRAEEELERYRAHLEDLVRDRTSDLEKANRKLQELDRLKSMFIASMSHELRTPLNSIIGFTGILLQGLAGEVNGEQKKQLGIVKDSAVHLLNLVNDVIDVSKIEAGKTEILVENFDLSKLIREVAASFGVAAGRKGLVISCDVPASCPVDSDRRRIRQILVNLVGNAVKFTEKGAVDIMLRGSGKNAGIEVRDTGIGIREEDMGKLFTAFAQIVKGDIPKEGQGLGLYLSRKVAELLGGAIVAESEFGKGSIFTFFLAGEGHEDDTGDRG